MKATHLKTGDTVRYSDLPEDEEPMTGVVTAVDGSGLTIRLKHATVQMEYVNEGTELEELGLELVKGEG